METFGLILDWANKVVATWLFAGILGGVLILIAERFDRRKEPTDEDVRRVADLYRRYYGPHAAQVVADHMRGASFGPDGRHYAFLKRVLASASSGESDL